MKNLKTFNQFLKESRTNEMYDDDEPIFAGPEDIFGSGYKTDRRAKAIAKVLKAKVDDIVGIDSESAHISDEHKEAYDEIDKYTFDDNKAVEVNIPGSDGGETFLHDKFNNILKADDYGVNAYYMRKGDYDY